MAYWTNSTEHSTCWEACSFSASHDIPEMWILKRHFFVLARIFIIIIIIIINCNWDVIRWQWLYYRRILSTTEETEVRISSDKLIGKVGKDTIRMKHSARHCLHTAESFRVGSFSRSQIIPHLKRKAHQHIQSVLHFSVFILSNIQ